MQRAGSVPGEEGAGAVGKRAWPGLGDYGRQLGPRHKGVLGQHEVTGVKCLPCHSSVLPMAAPEARGQRGERGSGSRLALKNSRHRTERTADRWRRSRDKKEQRTRFHRGSYPPPSSPLPLLPWGMRCSIQAGACRGAWTEPLGRPGPDTDGQNASTTGPQERERRPRGRLKSQLWEVHSGGSMTKGEM